jgi:hypothetical protein
MSMAGTKGRLQGATRELALKWDQTRDHWQDQKSMEFEHRYLQELFASVDKTMVIVDKLDELLKKVRSDCE